MMLSGSILAGELSEVGSSRCRRHEPSVTLSKELVGKGGEDTYGADAKFIEFGDLEENLASKLTAEEVDSWWKKFRISSWIEIRVPDLNERLDSPREGWFAIYELSLLSGMRFPLP